MSKYEIARDIQELRSRIENLEQAVEHSKEPQHASDDASAMLQGMTGYSLAYSDTAAESDVARETSAQGQIFQQPAILPTALPTALPRARSSVDATTNDNGFLRCVYQAYRGAGFNPSFHSTTATAFSNLRAGSAGVSIIVGHADQGVIVTGTGQIVDGTDKFMATSNEASWRPHASRGVPGSRLVLFGCKVAGGTVGATFLSRVARVVRLEVGAWTGDVFCNSSGKVWGTGQFIVARPGLRLEAVDSPVMYDESMYDESEEEMNLLRFQSAQGYQDLPIDNVKSVNFSPIGSLAEQYQAVSAQEAHATSLLQLIDFANPFDTDDLPGAILVGQLTVTFETEAQEERLRTFRVLGYSLLQDTNFPTTYYWASPKLRSELQVPK